MLRHYKALSLCAAVVATAVSVAIAVEPANAKSKPVIVTAQREVPTRQVGYRDLNLAAFQDRKILIRRVDLAVGEVCAEANGTLAQVDHDSACRAIAWKGARPQIARAIDRATRLAANGGAPALASLAITISRPAA